MKALFFSLPLFFLAAFSAKAEDLSFADGALLARTQWVRGPGSPEESVLRVQFADAGGASVDPAGFRVQLWMPDMNHGSSPTRIEALNGGDGARIVGAYLVRNMYFTMGGFWEVRLTVKFADGRQETRAFPVEIGSAHGGGHH